MSISFRPSNVEQVSEAPDQEIGWHQSPTTNLGYLLDSRWTTVSSLSHLANPACGDLRNKTWALKCTGFQMTALPDVITGLQLDINGQRNGRIVDEIIQLTYLGNPIGSNNFEYVTDSEGHLKITNETQYGGSTDLWGTELTPTMLQDPSFGVILKFQSHPYYPHRCGITVDSVWLTVY